MATKNLLIFGAGGQAREVAQIVFEINKTNQTWKKILYVAESNAKIESKMPYYSQVLKESEIDNRHKGWDAIIAVGSPLLRQQILSNIENKNLDFRFPNIIHPRVHIDTDNVNLGIGNIITLGCVLTCNITIGNFNLINWNCTLGHDACIDSFNTIGPNVNISGKVTIGSHCLLGVGAQILEGIEISDNNRIGAGAVVLKSILSHDGTYIGIPAIRMVK